VVKSLAMEMYRIGQAAKDSGWSRQWLHELIRRGDVFADIIGGVVFLSAGEVARLKKRKAPLRGLSIREK